jgi:hypothetical protein
MLSKCSYHNLATFLFIFANQMIARSQLAFSAFSLELSSVQERLRLTLKTV